MSRSISLRELPYDRILFKHLYYVLLWEYIWNSIFTMFYIESSSVSNFVVEKDVSVSLHNILSFLQVFFFIKKNVKRFKHANNDISNNVIIQSCNAIITHPLSHLTFYYSKQWSCTKSFIKDNNALNCICSNVQLSMLCRSSLGKIRTYSCQNYVLLDPPAKRFQNQQLLYTHQHTILKAIFISLNTIKQTYTPNLSRS